MLPHHPSNLHSGPLPGGIPPNTVATFPDGMPMASAPPPPLPSQPSGLKGQASGALSDLLGLESELTSIQVSKQNTVGEI